MSRACACEAPVVVTHEPIRDPLSPLRVTHEPQKFSILVLTFFLSQFFISIEPTLTHRNQ